MTARLDLMVAPSGAGKTHFLWMRGHVYGIRERHILSTDMLREDLTGNFRDQSKNDQVYAALRDLVKTRIEHGLPTVVDATNIRDADRKALVDLVPTSVPVRYFVLNRSMEVKRQDGGWRNHVEDIDLIAKHDQTFRDNLPSILNGDGYPNVKVLDLREEK
jgi:predicted kinase